MIPYIQNLRLISFVSSGLIFRLIFILLDFIHNYQWLINQPLEIKIWINLVIVKNLSHFEMN